MGEPDAVWEQTSLWILLPQTAIGITLETVTQAHSCTALCTHRHKHKQCDLSSPLQHKPSFVPSPSHGLWLIYAFILFLSSLWGRFAKLIIVLDYGIEKMQCTSRPILNKHTDALYGSLTVAPDHTFSWIHELPMDSPFLEWFVCVSVRVHVCPPVWHTEEYSFPTFQFHAALIYEAPPKVSN